MSNHDSQNEEILDRNVGELLRRRHEPPVISDTASARILAALEDKLPAPAESGAREGSDLGFLARLFSRPLYAGLVAAAAASAVIAGGVALNRGTSEKPTAVAVTGDYKNDDARPKRIELADGSALTLRAGAHVRVTALRAAELVAGDALFDIAKSDQPYTIARPGSDGRVVVLGTRFVLSATDAGTLAAVIRGSVRLEGKGGKLLLGAGEGGELPAAGAPVRRPVPRLSHLVSWSRSARVRSEGKDTSAARKGNLIARFAGWDGQDYPLPVRDYTVDVHLENQVARVAVDQTFFNEYPGQLEGIYSFNLPGDAAISRLAMYVNGELMEAGIAERDRARRVYESIVYRRRDPALMEWMAGNEVKVRIFPLFGRQEKRILLSYTQSLERLYDDVQLTVPLPRLDRPVGKLSFNARLVGCAECEVVSTSHAIQTEVSGADKLVTFAATKHKIEDDLLLTIRQPVARQRVVSHTDGAHQLAIAHVVPELEQPTMTGTRKPRRWVILHDTSASRSATERAAQVHVADRLLEELDENDEVAVVAFDATVRPMSDASNTFTSVANANRKGIHQFLTRQGRDGVGYTDLGAGLRAAADMLAKAPDADSRESFVIYLGDGVATGGDRAARNLAKIVKGRASVVSIAVGASQDMTTLGVLASETGGMTAVFNPGEDLDWRVFDLVAALNTDRVTGLTAELVGYQMADTRGVLGINNATPPEIYLSQTQLATGEELSIVTRTFGSLPQAVRLSGVRGGEPWTLEVPIAGKQSATEAEYLPRLWARERIASLLADENPAQHKDAITALAMKHWLLTPHTSLLVLENNAAYKRFKVARSSTEGWAAYKTPSKIKVVSEPLTSGVNLASRSINALVFRAPFELFAQSYQYALRGRRFAATRGTIGLGLSGTGRGFGGEMGVVTGAIGGGGTRSQFLPTEARDEAAQPRHTRGGLIGDLVDTSRRVEADRLSNEEGEAAGFDPIVAAEAPKASSSSLGWGAIREKTSKNKRADKAYGPSYHRGLDVSGFPVQPIALHYTGDHRLRDLTSLIPALFSAELDRERERLVRAKNGKRLDVAPAAAKAIERARELAGRRVYARSSRESVRVDSAGRFRAERRTFTGLREHLLYDGDALVTLYPDIDLAIKRDVGDAEPLLLEAELPFLLARPERLSRFYTITGDNRAVTLQVPKLSWKLVIRFDDRGRLSAVSRADGAVVSELVRIEYADGAVVVHRGSQATRFTVTAASDALALDVPAAATSIATPLRRPAFVKAALEGTSGAERRRLQRQLAASYAALSMTGDLGKLAIEMAKDAPLSTGELVLASGGVTTIKAAGFAQVVRKSEAAAPLRELLAADRRFFAGGANRLGAFATAGKDTSWFGNVALYRHVLALATQYNQRSKAKDVVAGVTELASRELGPELPYIAATMFGQYNSWSSPKRVAEAWRHLARSFTGTWALAARTQLARNLSNSRDRLEATAVWTELIGDAIEAGAILPIDYTTRSAFYSSPRGQAGWQAFWATTRDQVIARRDAAQLAGLLRVAMVVGHHNDAARLATAAVDAGLSTGQRLELVQLLVTYGKRDVAFSLFEPLAKTLDSSAPSDPGVLMLASQFAADRGDKLQAARLYSKALAASDGEVPLGQLRQEYAHLVGLYHQGAVLAVGDKRQQAHDRLLEVAAEWRVLDPDNPTIDNLVSTALFAIGDAKEAMRVLSTAIERHPMEGRSFQTVATVLQNQGRLEQALTMWQRAADVEPENPTWLLRLAQAKVASGDSAGAKKVLDGVAAKRKGYHERFEWIVRQALDIRKQL